jgi:hypothetical protein
LFNGIFKVPMQFLILFIGVMVFVFYVFSRPPAYFDRPAMAQAATQHGAEIAALTARHDQAFAERRDAALGFLAARDTPDQAAARATLQAAAKRFDDVHHDTKQLIDTTLATKTNDNDYVFLSFVLEHLPIGLVGLLIAVILCAAMSAVASGLISLGVTTTVDFYLRPLCSAGRRPRRHDLRVRRQRRSLGRVRDRVRQRASLLPT